MWHSFFANINFCDINFCELVTQKTVYFATFIFSNGPIESIETHYNTGRVSSVFLVGIYKKLCDAMASYSEKM